VLGRVDSILFDAGKTGIRIHQLRLDILQSDVLFFDSFLRGRAILLRDFAVVRILVMEGFGWVVPFDLAGDAFRAVPFELGRCSLRDVRAIWGLPLQYLFYNASRLFSSFGLCLVRVKLLRWIAVNLFVPLNHPDRLLLGREVFSFVVLGIVFICQRLEAAVSGDTIIGLFRHFPL